MSASVPTSSTETSPGAEAASRLVRARLEARALPGFPGMLPTSLREAYACQDAAIALWPDVIAGWKVGYISAARRDADGDDRVTGPIFSRSVWHDQPGHRLDFPAFVGGFCAVEAEYVFRLGDDAPAGKLHWTADEAVALVASLHIGVETAGSPMAMINELGPCAVAADFGNNAGLILGREIPDWINRSEFEMRCSCSIEGREPALGGAASIPGGLRSALAFALGRCARRGLSMRKGMLITTGAATGIHDILPGESARISFGPWGDIDCRAVAAVAMVVDSSRQATP